MSGQSAELILELGTHEEAVDARLRTWQAEQMGRRIWERDHTVWAAQPLPDLTDRLGWLSLPMTDRDQLDQFEELSREVARDDIRHVVLLGMGGSSLAPEVFASVFGSESGHPELLVLDSTHPDAVLNMARQVDLETTVFLVSSKSGTTVETLSLFRWFWRRVDETSDSPGKHFLAITDSGSPLEGLAERNHFRGVFNAPADVGGRYSALSAFGLVPAALIGADVRGILSSARVMAETSSPAVDPVLNPGLTLGAVLGELAVAGVDKITFVTSPALARVPSWIEQLIAESTGKNGKGLLPVESEPELPSESYGQDRFFVFIGLKGSEAAARPAGSTALRSGTGHPAAYIDLPRKTDLGQEMFRWELAVAAAGSILGINPFDQPDVQLAKDLARRAMEEDPTTAQSDSTERATIPARSQSLGPRIQQWASASPGDYVAIQAYLAPSTATEASLQELRRVLGRRLGVATTLGYGPRFLHSTGQLHKGGPATGHFLQLVDTPEADLPVPETSYTFAELIRAQAEGDYAALVQRGRSVLRVDLERDVEGGVKRLLGLLR
jgi:transaldolase/glucose-6-phosphate isomerase